MSDPYEPSRDTQRQHTGQRKNGKAPGLPAWTPNYGDEPQAFADYLNELWPELRPDPIVGAERFGRHGDAPIALVRRSGDRIRWPHQTTMQKPNGLQGVMMLEARVPPRKLSPLDTMVVAWAITSLSDLRADLDPVEEFVSWWADYVNERKPRPADPTVLPTWRALLSEWQAAANSDELRKPDEPRRTFIVVDERDDVRYVLRNDFARHVRGLRRGGVSWPTLNGRAAEAGWQQTRFQMRPSSIGAPYVQARVFVVPPNWPDGAGEEA